MTVTPTYAQPVQGDLRVGHVFSSAWDVLTANFGKFLAITAVVALPNVLLFGNMAADPAAAEAAFGWRFFLGFLLGFVLNMIAQAMILYIAFQYLRGQPASLSDAAQKGLGRFFPLLGAVILFGLGVWVGLLLFIVP